MESRIIRFRRIGRCRKPAYNIVVSLKTSTVRGKYIEKLGFYSPASNNKLFFLNLARLSFWLMRGASVSSRCGLVVGKFVPPSSIDKK